MDITEETEQYYREDRPSKKIRIPGKPEVQPSTISLEQAAMAKRQLAEKRAEYKSTWKILDLIPRTDMARLAAFFFRMYSLATEICTLERQVANYRRSHGRSVLP